MAPPPSPHSFFADQIAQDAFDANLNKTVFLIALAFAVLIQVCVLVYLAWLVVRRCFGRSRGNVPDQGDESEDVQDGGEGEGERKCVKEEGLEVPSLPRELVLPGLTSSSPSLTPSTTLPSRHHRSPSLRESIFGSPSSESQPDDNEKPASSSSWFNLRWSWEVPVVQIDLERAASPASPSSPAGSPASSPPASNTVSASATSSPDLATPHSLATTTSASSLTTASAASLATPTSAPFSVATPTQILSSELKQAHLQVPRIVISPPSAFPCPSSPPASPDSPSSITGATIDFEMDVDSALGIDTPNHDEDGEQGREEEQIQTRIDPTYLFVPPTSCYPPRELVESPSGRGFDVSFSLSSPSFLEGSFECSPSREESMISKRENSQKKEKKTKSKIAKRKSPGAYENTNTSNADENTTQPTRSKEKTLSSRLFGALADLSNFTGLTARPSLPTASSGSVSQSSAPSSAAASSLNLTVTPNESFFLRCEEALYESSGHGGVW